MTRDRLALVVFATVTLAACKTALPDRPAGGPGSAHAEKDLRSVLGPRLERSRGEPRSPNEDEITLDEITLESPPLVTAPPPKDADADAPNDLAEGEEEGGERARDDGVDEGRGSRGGGEDPRKAKPRAATASALGGKLNADQVNAVIDANFERLSSCSNSEAIVSIRATVSTDGRVLEASAPRSTPDDPRIRDCITSTFKTLEFPRIASEWPTRLSFDLRVGGS